MTKYKAESSSEDDSEYDSEEELQKAFAAGKIKPGLNTVIERPKRVFANNVVSIWWYNY